MDINSCRKILLGAQPTDEAEDWLVDNVCRDEEGEPAVRLSRNFLLSDFSRPFLNSLSHHLYGEGAEYIMGPYYEFISVRGGLAKIPYYKVKCFSRKHNSRLRTYLSVISARHFTHLRAKELEDEHLHSYIDAADRESSKKTEPDLKENQWFSLLLSDDHENLTWEQTILMKKLEQAIAKLPERERRVIQLTVMDDMSGLDAFEELSDLLESEAKTDLEKQKAIAVLKFRAIAKLRKLMTQ